jgi:uncharacterized membrane protein YvlD (DUF360 family)
MTSRITRGDIIAAVGAAMLLFSLSRVWYGLAISDLGRGFNASAFGVKLPDQNIVEKTGWGASAIVGFILLAFGVVTLAVVASRIAGVALANRPGDIVRGAGAAAAVLVLVRIFIKPSLIPGAQASFISGLPGPHLEMGIFIALIGACAIGVAGFLIEIDDAKIAAGAQDEAPSLAYAQLAGAAVRVDEVPDFLTSPPAWLREQASQGPGAPPPPN